MEVNLKYFQGNKYKEIVRYASKGLLKPEQDKLKVGHYYYRIGHAKNPHWPTQTERIKAYQSSWWMDFETLKLIMVFAEQNDVSLTVSGRIKNAVAHEFGKSNILIRGRLSAPTRALIGAGRPIESGNNVFFPPGDVKQIFIPGLRDHGVLEKIFPSKHRSFEPIYKGNIVVRGE